jgi:predicted ArsR family transcriptional regulator
MTEEGSGLTAVSSLEDPVRARLYEVVCESAGPVSRDAAAAAAGIGRPLAAYHLDKMVDLGLLSAVYQRPAGRAGPGAGRPAKVYFRSGREFAVTVPPREYELAARLLATAVEADSAGASRAALKDAARQFGAGLAEDAGAEAEDAKTVIQAVLRRHGFEPWQDEDGRIRLRNCPFHGLARLHPELVCGMNLALIDGLVAALGARDLRADLQPRPGQCCVQIGAQATSTTGRS